MSTAYEQAVQTKIDEMVDYIKKHNMQDDDFAKSEVQRLEDELAKLADKPRSFVTAIARSKEEVEPYLGFGAAIVSEHDLSHRGRTEYGAVLEIFTEHATWQSQRLQSGLIGSGVYSTQAAAAGAL